jgi:hypothetical protein
MRKNFETYAIISIDDLPKIDFKQTGVTSRDTIRRSIDLTMFLIAWDVEPEFIDNGDVIPIGQYDHIEILEIMQSEEWSGEDN